MSRIGKKPIVLPKGVSVTFNAPVLEVKGTGGSLKRNIPKEIDVQVKDGKVELSVKAEFAAPQTSALYGLTRTLVDNMVQGVVHPWKKDLEIQGVGFRASKNGQVLNLQVGYSHPIDFKVPAAVQFNVDGKQTLISMTSADKELLGTVAAQVRSLRPPEPYKGKGIRYVGEHILRKAGKAAGAVGGGAKK